MRLANFYAPSPRCTPSRASLVTGKSPARLHMTFVNDGGAGDNSNHRLMAPASSTELPATETTIAELLKQAGYATAHFGKWHLGKANPSQHGFEENDGANGNGGPDNVANPHPKQLYAMTERGLGFIMQQVKAGKPFYLQLSHYAARQGGDATAQTLAAVQRWGAHRNERQLTEAAADFDLDLALGLLLKKLDDLEGGSLASVLTNGGRGQVQRPAEPFVVHFPHYDKDPIGPASALYLGNLKLIRPYETGVCRLFDIFQDPGERHDRAAQMPAKVTELNQRLTQYLLEVSAATPKINSSYVPGRGRTTEIRHDWKPKGSQ